MATPDRITVPEDLTSLDDAALAELEEQATARFDADYDAASSAEEIDALAELGADIQRVRAERSSRETDAAERTARRESLRELVHPAEDSTSEPQGDSDDDGDSDDSGGGEGGGDGGDGGERRTERETREVETEPARGELVEAAVAAAVARELAPVLQVIGERLPPLPAGRTSLAAARAHQPTQPAPPARRLQVHAGADIPRIAHGGTLDDLDALSFAVRERSKSMHPTHTELPPGVPMTYDRFPGHVVASMQNDYPNVIDGERTSAVEVEELWHELVDGDQADSLLAGGGWCAPSETRYDFYNVTCTDGLVDLPSFGVQRGGIKYPISPSFADLFTGTFSATGVPWLWTETDDIATVTGAPNKPCVRVPCPTFADVRLECYGLCVTAGNLTDDAYPEATRNFLRYVYAAHERAVNARYMQQVVALSTAAVSGTGLLGSTAISVDLPAAVEWEGIDYRARYNMCDNAVLEAIFPYWIRAILRTDISARTGREAIDVTNAEIDRLFTSRGVRPQWVKDWQMRGVNQPGAAAGTVRYPSSVTFLLFAAGTFIRGNGLVLDLGVTRDSVLNSENDFTAAWMEECHLIARIGHESRAYTVNICAAGRTGANDLTNCRT